jgi:hypothetical protein
MRGFVPRIHVLFSGRGSWMAGTEAGHDDKGETIRANRVAENILLGQ